MISSSRVALAAACEGAFALPQHDEKNEFQDYGNERHEEGEALVMSGGIDDALAHRWPGYTWRAEVAFTIDLATGVARELGAGIKRAYPTDGVFSLSGTADIVGRGPAGELVIVERKSFDPGVARAAVNAQCHSNALMACRAYGVDEADIAVMHETRPLDVAHVDLFALETFHLELVGILTKSAAARKKVRDGLKLDLRPGQHCRWCAAFHNCDATRDLALDVHSGEADMRIAGMLPFASDEDAARAFEFLERVKLLTKRLSSALYARGAERPIPLGEGRWFGKHKKLGNTELDADVVYDVVRAKHGQDIADAAVTREATQASIERALKKIAKRGQGAEMQRDVMAEIKARGGAKREETEKVEVFTHQLQAVNDV